MIKLMKMESEPLLDGSEEYYIQDEDGLHHINGNFNLGVLPIPDSLPELNFDAVEQQLCELSGPKMAHRGPPERTPLSGKYDFVVEINSSHTHKKKYVFSHKLNRIYVDLEVDFPVQFNWRGPANMFVRAMCVFADAAQAEKRVERCLQHFYQSTYTDPVISHNVLHSSRPPGTAGVTYCGTATAPDSWLSVAVALHKPGAEAAQHAYRFTCKNSCASGINRRAILIVFTLEDAHGEVHGRQIVGARVCACPRRDMQKDEENDAPRAGKRRVGAAPHAPTPPPTKVKREGSAEGAVIDLSLQLLNPQAAILGLEVMIKMEEQADEARRDPRARDVIQRLKMAQEELKRRHPTQ